MSATCGTCRYFDPIIVHEDEYDTDGAPETICRRFPPVDGWSSVLADDWCGEWSETADV